jgi:alpha/beta superfamily hydrolase
VAVNAQPLFFGPPERPLFGWLHQPPAERPATAGLIVCNPFGNEALCAHRSIRHLCRQAASSGIAALRFDYDGTGDSAGHDGEAGRIEAWLASIQAAADTLKETSGITRVYFAGFRIGATLATLAALRRSDVQGLIAIAPVVNGGAYVRELKLLQRAMEARRDFVAHREDTSTLESAGFLLTAQTQASLKAIDLANIIQAPCPRLLILDRAEMPIDLSFVPALRARGITIERRAVRGYTEMMLDPHQSVVPHEIIAAALGWLGRVEQEAVAAAPTGTVHHDAASVRETATLAPSAVADPATGPGRPIPANERLVRLGAEPGLFGVLTTPPEGTAAAGAASAVLLLNAGAVHHVGPNRVYVALARHLARLGHAVLRLDIAGIGDSDPRSAEAENVVYPHAALEDVHSGIEFLRREAGTTDVRVVGLCSGAYHGFKAAVARLPLSAALIVNPLTFFWKDGMSLAYPSHRVAADIQRYRSNAFSLVSWGKLLSGGVDLRQLSGVLRQHLGTALAKPVHAMARAFGRPFPDDLPTELRHAANAGIGLNFVFSDSDPGLELLRQGGGRSARHMLADGELSVTVIAGADHTFTDLNARAALVEVLTRAVHLPPRGAANVAADTPQPPAGVSRRAVTPYS